MRSFSEEELRKIKQFAGMTDLEFYEKYVANASLQEQAEFLNEFPEFMMEDKAEGDAEGRRNHRKSEKV